MNRSRFLRASTLAAALGAALSAHAIYIGIDSHGFTTDGATIAETVDFQAGGFGPLAALTYTVTSGTGTDLFEGTGVYTGTGGALDFSFSLKSASSDGANSVAYVGTWKETGGAGNYLGSTGTGTITTNLYNVGSTGSTANTLTTFAGAVQAVPEPSAFAALGLGGLALLRRRRS